MLQGSGGELHAVSGCRSGDTAIHHRLKACGAPWVKALTGIGDGREAEGTACWSGACASWQPMVDGARGRGRWHPVSAAHRLDHLWPGRTPSMSVTMDRNRCHGRKAV